MAKKGFIHHSKNLLVAHEGNDYHPHLFRIKGVILLFLIVVVFEVALLAGFTLLKNKDFLAADVIGAVLINETNQRRTELDVPELRESEILNLAAELKAEDMIANGYFAHFSPQGVSPWYWLEQAGYRYLSAGENLAIDFYDSNEVVNAWMNSPLHRQNILKQKYTEIGIAVKEGEFNGRKRIFVVQFFGTPKNNFNQLKSIEINNASSTSLLNRRTGTTTASTTVLGITGSTSALNGSSTVAGAAVNVQNGGQNNILRASVIATNELGLEANQQKDHRQKPHRDISGFVSRSLSQLGASSKHIVQITLVALSLIVLLVAANSFVFAKEKVSRKFVLMLAITLLMLAVLVAINSIVLLPKTSTIETNVESVDR